MVVALDARRRGVATELLHACTLLGVHVLTLSILSSSCLYQHNGALLVYWKSQQTRPSAAGRRWRHDSTWLHVEERNAAGLGLYQVCGRQIDAHLQKRFEVYWCIYHLIQVPHC